MVDDGHCYFPAVVAVPKTAEECAKVVSFANQNKISLAVNCGGHSGNVGMSKAIAVQMTSFKTVTVDTSVEPAVVCVGGGALLGDVDTACEPHGIALTQGNASCVGAVGSMLGGGYGYLARWNGLSIDNVLSMTVVLASGEVVEASNDDGGDKELFWALRGGGGAFGVVTAFKAKAVKVGWDDAHGRGRMVERVRVVRHNHSFFTCCGNGMPNGDLDVLKAWRDYTQEAPESVSAATFLICGGPMIQDFSFKGPIEEGHQEAEKWKDFGRTIFSFGGVKS